MPRRVAAALIIVLLGQALTPAGSTAQAVATSPSPRALTVEEQLAFLATARAVSAQKIGKGITGALRVVLSDGTRTHEAAFQSIAEEPRFDGRKRAGELRFSDHYRYNVAAWRLASHLGLGAMMPPTVERHVDGKRGALSWWVDDVMMDEAEREAKDLQPPDARSFTRQRQRMAVFAELVRDTDRNKGNVVYTNDWRVIMLDFTRAFRLETPLRTPSLLAICDRALLAAMRALTRDALNRVLDGALSGDETKAILTRRDLLVAHFDRLIAERGEAVVLY
ncbi:MAG: hypothetical protein IT181_17435 [Acidobacteria bacterium]|nr:hypothetical protein [Acidobacteriota bacterium]